MDCQLVCVTCSGQVDVIPFDSCKERAEFMDTLHTDDYTLIMTFEGSYQITYCDSW